MVCPFLHGKTGKMILYGCKGKYITEPEQEGYKVSGQTKVWQKQRIKDKVLWIEMPGELDHHSADQISREADRLVRERDIREIVFDFSDTVFCDSSGIGMLMGRYKMMRALGGTVRAVRVQERVGKILMLSGVMKIIPVESKQGGIAE